MVEKEMYDLVIETRKLYPDFDHMKDKFGLNLKFRLLWLRLKGTFARRAEVVLLYKGNQTMIAVVSWKDYSSRLDIKKKYDISREYTINVKYGYDWLSFTSKNFSDIRKCLGL